MTTPYEARLVDEARRRPLPAGVELVYGSAGRLRSVIVDGNALEVERLVERGRTNRLGQRWRATIPAEAMGTPEPLVTTRLETRQGALAAAVAILRAGR